jgi:putative lipoprotein
MSPSEPAEPLADAASLANTQWRLVSFGAPGAETPVVEGSAITLEFKAEGEAGGSGGCNSYGGQYQVQGDTLSFGDVMSTLMACVDEGISQQEQAYFQALQTVGRFELAGDQLTIWYNNDQGVLNFVK